MSPYDESALYASSYPAAAYNSWTMSKQSGATLPGKSAFGWGLNPSSSHHLSTSPTGMCFSSGSPQHTSGMMSSLPSMLPHQPSDSGSPSSYYSPSSSSYLYGRADPMSTLRTDPMSSLRFSSKHTSPPPTFSYRQTPLNACQYTNGVTSIV